jgi:hypothetical protein
VTVPVAVRNVLLRTLPEASGGTPTAAGGTHALPISPASWNKFIPTIATSQVKSASNCRCYETLVC